MTGMIEKFVPPLAVLATLLAVAWFFLSPRTDEELAGSEWWREVKQEDADLDRAASEWELLAACLEDRTRPDCTELEGEPK